MQRLWKAMGNTAIGGDYPKGPGEMRVRSSKWDWLVLALTCTTITIVSLVPEGQIPSGVAIIMLPAVTNYGHVPAYALLVILLIRVISSRVSVTWRILAAIVVSTMLFGAMMEVLQLLTGRTASLGDLAYDGVGVAIGTVLMRSRVCCASVVRKAMD